MKECHLSRMVPLAVAACATLTNLSGSCLAVDGVFDVRDYGAVGNGKKVDTAAIDGLLEMTTEDDTRPLQALQAPTPTGDPEWMS